MRSVRRIEEDRMISAVVITAHDRCDRCGAQAKIEWTKIGAPSVLLFCGHHSTRYLVELHKQGFFASLKLAA